MTQSQNIEIGQKFGELESELWDKKSKLLDWKSKMWDFKWNLRDKESEYWDKIEK